jgi:hypothetical protein
MSSTLKYTLAIVIVLLLASIPLAMQRETGGIEGLIINELGPISNASVEARNVMSGVVFRARSDTAGHYTLENLPRGRYSLWVRASEHDSQWIREIVVEQGRTAHRDIRLGRDRQPSPQSGGA